MRGLIQLFLCLASEDSATPSTDVDRETHPTATSNIRIQLSHIKSYNESELIESFLTISHPVLSSVLIKASPGEMTSTFHYGLRMRLFGLLVTLALLPEHCC